MLQNKWGKLDSIMLIPKFKSNSIDGDLTQSQQIIPFLNGKQKDMPEPVYFCTWYFDKDFDIYP